MTEREKPTESDNAVSQAVADYFFGYVCRHLVCLGVRYVELDESGKPKGQDQFIGYSGFIMSISGMWFLVTAGHVLTDELDKLLAEKKYRS